MHELSVAMTLAETVAAEAVRHGAVRVAVVRLKLGALTDLDAEALRFGWAVIAAEEGPLRGAKLEIDRVPVTVFCRTCGHEGESRPPGVCCGTCGSYHTRLLTGEELDLAEVVLDVP